MPHTDYSSSLSYHVAAYITENCITLGRDNNMGCLIIYFFEFMYAVTNVMHGPTPELDHYLPWWRKHWLVSKFSVLGQRILPNPKKWLAIQNRVTCNCMRIRFYNHSYFGIECTLFFIVISCTSHSLPTVFSSLNLIFIPYISMQGFIINVCHV